MRINKYLAGAGVCSRREADRLIADGKVTIDGHIAGLGEQVREGMEVHLNGIPLAPEEERIILAYNKPVGVVCTTSKKDPDNIIDAIGYPKRIYPVGRLDKDSGGLILLTNDGSLADAVMRAGNYHEKEYLVSVDRAISQSFLDGMREGVMLDGILTRKCEISKISSNKFDIILTQGLNRQIRRMCEYFGYRVKSLNRIRVVNITLGSLSVGRYRSLSPAERCELYEELGLEA